MTRVGEQRLTRMWDVFTSKCPVSVAAPLVAAGHDYRNNLVREDVDDNLSWLILLALPV